MFEVEKKISKITLKICLGSPRSEGGTKLHLTVYLPEYKIKTRIICYYIKDGNDKTDRAHNGCLGISTLTNIRLVMWLWR